MDVAQSDVGDSGVVKLKVGGIFPKDVFLEMLCKHVGGVGGRRP